MGEWDDPYLTMAPAYQATIVRELATFAEKGLVYKAKKSVHWCISCRTALAEAEVEYDEHHESPQIDVRFALAPADAAKLAAAHPSLAGRAVFAVAWTTTPWTLPANLALAFHPEAEYAFYPVEGKPDVLLLAKALHEKAAARFGLALGAPLAELQGAELEHVRFRHPWIDRDSPGVLADYVTLDTGTGVVHTAPGHGWDDYLTGVRYGLDIYCPVDEGGRFLPEVERFAGQRVFEANPRVIELLREKGALAQAGKDTHSYPHLLALQAPDHLPRHRAVVHRARPGPADAARAGARRDRRHALAAGVGPGPDPQHDRVAPRLVHLAPAALGRADPCLLLQELRRGAAAPRAAPPRGRRLRARRAPTPGTRRRRRRSCPRASRARSAAGTEFEQGARHPRRLVRLGLVARRRAGPAHGPAVAVRRLPRGQRPAPGLVPLVAADRGRRPAAARPTSR